MTLEEIRKNYTAISKDADEMNWETTYDLQTRIKEVKNVVVFLLKEMDKTNNCRGAGSRPVCECLIKDIERLKIDNSNLKTKYYNFKNNKKARLDKQLLYDLSSKHNDSDALMCVIVDIVCEEYSVSRVDILSNVRYRYASLPRHICFWLGRELGLGLECIGLYMGKNHTTVLCGSNTIKNIIATDKTFASTVYELKRRIQNIINSMNGGKDVKQTEEILEVA